MESSTLCRVQCTSQLVPHLLGEPQIEHPEVTDERPDGISAWQTMALDLRVALLLVQKE